VVGLVHGGSVKVGRFGGAVPVQNSV